MENLGWGLQMTVVGMGLVFALLALLWGLLHLVLKLDNAPAKTLAPEATMEHAERIAAVADDAVGRQVPVSPTVQGMEADLVAAIAIAAITHREVRRMAAAPAMRANWPGSQLFASRWVTSGRARQTNTFNRRSG